MDNYVNIATLVERCPNTILSVRARDLKLFSEMLIEGVLQAMEKEKTNIERDDDYLDAETIISMLGISRATLYRLVQRGVLRPPTWVGGQRRWHHADIEAMMEGR